MTRTLVPKTRLAGKRRFLGLNGPLFATRGEESLIQWPTERAIREVSAKLARIRSVGIRSEAEGDYFSSGELAYQLQQIIQATAELLKKSQRAKRQPIW